MGTCMQKEHDQLLPFHMLAAYIFAFSFPRYIGSAVCKIGDLNQNDLMTEKEVHTVLNIGKTRMQKSASATSMSSLVDSGDEMPLIYDGSSGAEVVATSHALIMTKMSKIIMHRNNFISVMKIYFEGLGSRP